MVLGYEDGGIAEAAGADDIAYSTMNDAVTAAPSLPG
jgi:hypothetical protein